MTCVCGTCFYTFAIGSEPSAAARMKLNALIGDASRAWDGDASDGLFAAVYRAGIDFARIRGGRTARLPSLSTTACLPNILAIDARATSVLLTDCPLDESSIFVRWMELRGRTWVDRVEPLDAHVRSPSRIRGILVNGVPAVFSASGATGAAHRVEGGAWHAVEHRWATRP
jgi:hypothetical protein